MEDRVGNGSLTSVGFDLEISRRPLKKTVIPKWNQERSEIAGELKALCPTLSEHRGFDLELTDEANGIQIYLRSNGSAGLSIAGWGDWFTRANQVRAYLDVFERRGFGAYDPQGGTRWESGRSVEEITQYLEKLTIPPITATGQGCRLKPLQDHEWPD